MAETTREEDSQSSRDQQTSKEGTGDSHNNQASAMHTKQLKDSPNTQDTTTSTSSSSPSSPPTITPHTATNSPPSQPPLPQAEPSDEACLEHSEPGSPASEEALSSGGEQVPFSDDQKVYMSHYGYQYPVVPLGNGVVSTGEGMMAPTSLAPTTVWSGSNETSMQEGTYLPVMEPQPYLPGSQPTSEPNSPPPEGEGLKGTLVRQLEYYFSKENLSSDKYLLSQMDGDHFVSVSVIANFSKVKRLTTDINLVIEAIRESHQLQLDERGEKVRAVPEKRCVLILREIPKETSPELIKGLFSSDKCPNFSTCEFAENDCWYITFDSEEDTQKAFAHLREDVREFLGQPIRARIKGTSVQRPSAPPKKQHYYPVQNVYNGQQPVQYYPQHMTQWSSYYPNDPGYLPYVNGYPPHQAFSGPPNHYPNHPPMSHHPHLNPPPERPTGRMMGGRSHSNHGNHSNHSRGHLSSSSVNGSTGREEGGGGRGGGREHFSSGPGRGRKEEDAKKSIPRLNRKQSRETESRSQRQLGHSPQKAIDHSPAHFPPLAGSSIPPPPPPPPTPLEQGISNLADIVKGKHLKEAVSPTNSTAPSQPQKEPTKPSAPPAKPPPVPPSPPSSSSSSSTSPAQPSKPAPVGNGAPPTPQGNGVNPPASQPAPAPQTAPKPRPEAKVAPAKDPSRPAPPAKSQGPIRSNDRDLNSSSRSHRTQVYRSEGRPPPMGRGRHRDRDRGLANDRDRRPGTSRGQPRPSPKPPRKAPPPPPTSPTSPEKAPAKQENSGASSANANSNTGGGSGSGAGGGGGGGGGGGKSDGKLSYAQMAQKAPAPPKTPLNSSNTNGNCTSTAAGNPASEPASPDQQSKTVGGASSPGPAAEPTSPDSDRSSIAQPKHSSHVTSAPPPPPEAVSVST